MSRPNAPLPGEERMVWVDVAKGACIVMVVLLHVTNLHLIHLAEVPADVADGWFWLSRWLRPIRMPLFFLISGLLTAPALGRRDKLRRRARTSAELYVIWLVLQTVLIDWPLRPELPSSSVGGLLAALVLPEGNLWYLWALAAYVAVVAIVPPRLRLPALTLFAVVGALAASRAWDLELRPRDLLMYLWWFALGAFVPGVARRVAGWWTRVRAVGMVAVFVVATAAIPEARVGLTPARQVVGVLTGIAVAACLTGAVAECLGRLGRRTLSIYVLHVPLLTVWAWAVARLGWKGGSPVAALTWCYPVVLTAAIVLASLGIEQLLRRAGAGRLFGDRAATTAIRVPATG